jgi:hypothetical protein
MRAEQTVNEMAQVVLWRQARVLAKRTGQTHASARGRHSDPGRAPA